MMGLSRPSSHNKWWLFGQSIRQHLIKQASIDNEKQSLSSWGSIANSKALHQVLQGYPLCVQNDLKVNA